MPIVTPVAARLHHMLEERYVEIDRDKLTRFALARAAKKDLGIIDCRGRPLSPGIGCVFEGGLRRLYWSSVKPCIDDSVQTCCDELEKVFASYTSEQRDDTIEYVEVSLKSFAARIYCRMRELDRGMRGRGFPESVQPYNPSVEIAKAHELVEYKLGVIKQHFIADAALPKLSDTWDGKLRLAFVTLDTARASAWFKTTRAGAFLGRAWDAISSKMGKLRKLFQSKRGAA
jgi:hypothetical protein